MGGMWLKLPSEAFYKELYQKKYILMQYNFVQFFAEHLADCSRTFGGDLQMMLILAILGQRRLDARIQRGFLEVGPAPADIVPLKAKGMNSSSIAEISGIPRETVRRKLDALAERGWVARDEHGRWRVAIVVTDASELTGLNGRQMDRVARFLANTQRIAFEVAEGGAVERPSRITEAESPRED